MSGEYIVCFKEGTANDIIEKAIEDVEKQGGEIKHRYNTTMLGFSAKLPDQVLTTMVNSNDVDFVEADGQVTAYAKTLGI
ncbi:hypothetical protein BCR36DRAFT_583229 [Piromyces finnis]|uniref:Inhibitor I9 domain-containing protein n=1 Tax=Piromyces finnis TaxID=1754191 RepID=A0A1Y1V9X0_9FUNG|nr:hypothetical protein BCR36DRAFT_583229 [Piromyces finnis]|eukprot:ORX50644.1 hypothetical protein BCR36DRAFT_583229 [Piromyces finnis]